MIIYDHLLRLKPEAANYGTIDSRDNSFLSADKAAVGSPRDGSSVGLKPCDADIDSTLLKSAKYGLKHL